MNIREWRKISVIFSLIVGTLLHFTYEWSGNNAVIGIVSAVNESTWEHLKLAFFPMLFIAIVGYFQFGNKMNNYIKGNVIGIIVAISFITVFFYTYTGIIGNNFAIIDISTFVVAVILGEVVASKISKRDNKTNEGIYFAILGILLMCFITFTYFPPQINYFKDPITNTYGIQN